MEWSLLGSSRNLLQREAWARGKPIQGSSCWCTPPECFQSSFANTLAPLALQECFWWAWSLASLIWTVGLPSARGRAKGLCVQVRVSSHMDPSFAVYFSAVWWDKEHTSQPCLQIQAYLQHMWATQLQRQSRAAHTEAWVPQSGVEEHSKGTVTMPFPFPWCSNLNGSSLNTMLSHCHSKHFAWTWIVPSSVSISQAWGIKCVT